MPELNEPPPKRMSPFAHYRVSGFNFSWHKGHPWLVCDKDQDRFCTLCQQFNKSSKRGMGVQGVYGFWLQQDEYVREQCASHKEAELLKQQVTVNVGFKWHFNKP